MDTAEKAIVKLKSTTKKEQDKAFKTYEKLIAKHGNKAPLNERLADSNKNKHFMVSVFLYIVPRQERDETDEEFKKRQKKKKLHKGVYEQVAALSLTVKGSETTLKNSLTKLLELNQLVNDYDSSEAFHALLEILRTNKEYKQAEQTIAQSANIEALYLNKYLPDAKQKRN